MSCSCFCGYLHVGQQQEKRRRNSLIAEKEKPNRRMAAFKKRKKNLSELPCCHSREATEEGLQFSFSHKTAGETERAKKIVCAIPRKFNFPLFGAHVR